MTTLTCASHCGRCFSGLSALPTVFKEILPVLGGSFSCFKSGEPVLVNVLLIPGFAGFVPVYAPDCSSLLASDCLSARKI